MKIAFLSEMGFSGKVPENHPNMRTEFAWMFALNADHHCIRDISVVLDYDHIFLIFPKGKTFLNSEGTRVLHGENPISNLLSFNLVQKLKDQGNRRIHYVQEGPHWWWNDYEIEDQINFYNLLAQCDSIFAHNEYDVKYYKGLFNKPVQTIPTLMVETLISSMIPKKESKVIIGGNFARWYGGFESYVIASHLNIPIYAQNSHAKREYEENIDNITHLPRLYWNDWMSTLKDFKYAVHLMPTIAAGTFSLNCAYFGIPCIGNKYVDTQRLCHPDLSVDVSDLDKALQLINRLKNDDSFYHHCSNQAKINYRNHYFIEDWKFTIINTLKKLS